MDYKTFTNDLAQYKENIMRLEKAKDKLKDFEYVMENVHGVSFDRIPSTYDKSKADQTMLERIEKYEQLANEVKRYETAISNVTAIRKKLPPRLWSMLREKFVLGKTYKSIAIKHGYSATGLWEYMRRETERYL